MYEGFPKELKYTEQKDPGKERDVNLIMEDIKKNTRIILDKIKSSIDRHEYEIILGIDSGGRVPALVLSNTINDIYTSRGEEKSKTFFVAGSRALFMQNEKSEKNKKLEDYFKQKHFEDIKNKNGKILIVEDVISSGASLEYITEVLQRFGLKYEIATLSFDDSRLKNNTYSDKDIAQMEEKLGSQIHYGEYGTISELYGSKQMQGVHKNPDLLFSKPLNKPVSELKLSNLTILEDNHFSQTEEYQNKEVLGHTRNLVSKISRELADDYLNKT